MISTNGLKERVRMFESILCQVTDYDPEILESLIGLAVEIAREGHEGRRIGTLFTIGDEDAVLAKSRSLILDPRKCTRIVVSESAVVRLFCHGHLIGEIIPELWMLK